jgi:hypothetical protein
MKSKLLLSGILVLMVVGIILIIGYVTKIQKTTNVTEEPGTTYHLSEKQLKVNIDESRAWLDRMPGDVNRKDILIPIEIENNASFDLNNLNIDRAEVIKNGEVVGDFKPKFQIREDCSGKFDNEKLVDEIDLLKGCKLSFNIKAWRNSDNLSDFEGAIKVRFKFVSNHYYSDIFETKEMTIFVVS